MLVIRQNADTFTIMSQELYSSASSDDQSSINSVVHVDIGDSTTDGEDGGEGDEAGRGEAGSGGERAEGETGESGGDYEEGEEDGDDDHGGNPGLRLPTARPQATRDADSSSDSDDDGIIRDSAEHDSDSSSSSEGTQVWVPVKASPGPSSKSASGRNGATPVIRHSVVSQSSVTGRLETSVVHDDHHHINGADSGISNESPDTTSSADHHYHGHHHRHEHHSYQHHTPGGRPASHIVPMPALHSPARTTPNTEEPEVMHVQPEGGEPVLSIRESLFNILSGLYALVLVTMGAALPVAEIFAAPVAPGVFETFYIYLFGMSIVFLLYVYTFLLSERTTSRLCRRRHLGEDSPFNKWSRRVSMGGNAHTGSFYLRLGAVAFGIGSMIHEGLMFGELFEFELTSPCVKVTEAIRPVLQLAFTFIQLYFIFLNSKMCIHKYRTLARFGLTHMVATNLCVWFRTVTKETVREVSRYMKDHNVSIYGMHVTNGAAVKNVSVGTSYNAVVLPTTGTPLVVKYGGTRFPDQDSTAVLNMTLMAARRTMEECPRQEILGEVVEAASPYLYPCTIEYSLIAAGILYVMWRNISKPPAPASTQETASLTSGGTNSKPDQVSVDCSGANRGLFLGIFTLVAATISTIVFFVLVERPEYVSSAVLVVHVSELVLYCLAVVAVAAAAYRIRGLRFHPTKDNALDESLLLVALAGQFVFCVFGAVAGRYNTESEGGVLVVSTSVLIMLQAAVQTVFILNALRRSSPRPYHQEVGKPGREYITFLLVINIAMWGMNVLEPLRTSANPVTRHFYGLLPWSVLAHLSSPLAVFYRFHSTVCLANIWKNAYRLRAQ